MTAADQISRKPTWCGPYGPGAMQGYRELKRIATEDRNARTLPGRRSTKRAWAALDIPGPAPCPCAEKETYPTPQAAAYVPGKLPKSRRTGGLQPYPCEAGGHWHLGRPHRALRRVA